MPSTPSLVAVVDTPDSVDDDRLMGREGVSSITPGARSLVLVPDPAFDAAPVYWYSESLSIEARVLER